MARSAESAAREKARKAAYNASKRKAKATPSPGPASRTSSAVIKSIQRQGRKNLKQNAYETRKLFKAIRSGTPISNRSSGT